MFPFSPVALGLQEYRRKVANAFPPLSGGSFFQNSFIEVPEERKALKDKGPEPEKPLEDTGRAKAPAEEIGREPTPWERFLRCGRCPAGVTEALTPSEPQEQEMTRHIHKRRYQIHYLGVSACRLCP